MKVKLIKAYSMSRVGDVLEVQRNIGLLLIKSGRAEEVKEIVRPTKKR